MIIFFTTNPEEVMLASVLKHFNEQALLIEYKNNDNIINIAKMYEESNFIRIKEYKLAILNQYDIPEWMKDDSKYRFIELILANKRTNIISLINHLASHLFEPEKLFYGALDKTVCFKDNALQAMKELNIFKRFSKIFMKNSIKYYEFNSEHNIIELFAKDMAKKENDSFVVINNDEAIVANARKIGFNEDFARLNKYDALRLTRRVFVNIPEKMMVKKTIATKIIEFQ
jgi:hypothetical protein